MRALIFSDSHKDMEIMRVVTEKLVKQVDVVIHLGDNYSDAEALSAEYSGLPFHFVPGNCDFTMRAQEKVNVLLGGKKVFITHGHLYSVKSSYDMIIKSAVSLNADICLFGHTHQPDVFYKDNILFFNPGSISQARNLSRPSYGVLEITGDTINPSVVAKYADSFRPIM